MYRTFTREPKYKPSKRERFHKNEEQKGAFEASSTSEEDEASSEKDTDYESEESGGSGCTTGEKEKEWEVGRRLYHKANEPRQLIIKTCTGNPRIRTQDKVTQKNLLSPFPSFLVPPIRREVSGPPNYRVTNVKPPKEEEKHREKYKKKNLKGEFSYTHCKSDRKDRKHCHQHKDRYHERQSKVERVLTCLHYDNMLKSNEPPESFAKPSAPTAGMSEGRREDEGSGVECPKRTHELETQGNSRRNLMSSCVKAREDEKPSNQGEVKEKLVYVVEGVGKDATKTETDLFTLNEILAIKKDLLELSEFAKKLKKLKETKKESDVNKNKGNVCNCKPADELLKDVNKRIESLEARQEELEKGSNRCDADSKKSRQTSSDSQPKIPETSDRSAMTVFHDFPKGDGVQYNTEIINELLDIKTQLQKLEQKRMLKAISDETMVKVNAKPGDKKDHGIAVFSSKTYILTPENFRRKNEENDKEKKKNDFFNVEDKTKSEMTNENVTNWLKNVSLEERKNEFPLFLATEQREQKNFGEIRPGFGYKNNAQILEEDDFENQARRYMMQKESSAEGFTQRIEYKKCLLTPSGKVVAVINQSREQFNNAIKEPKDKPLELLETSPVKNNRTTSSTSIPSAVLAKEQVQDLKNQTVKRESQTISVSLTRSIQELSASTATKSEKTVQNMKLKNLEKFGLSNFLREKKQKENKNEVVKRLEAKLLALKKSLKKKDPSTTSYSFSEFIASIDLDSEKVVADDKKSKMNSEGVAQYFTYMASTKHGKCDVDGTKCKQEEKERIKQLKEEIKKEKRALKDYKKKKKEECKRKAKEAKAKRKCKAKKEKNERKERKKLEKLLRKQQRQNICCSSSTPVTSTPPTTEESSPSETPPCPPKPPPKPPPPPPKPPPPRVIKSPMPCDIPTPYRPCPPKPCKPSCTNKLVSPSPKKHDLQTECTNVPISLKKDTQESEKSLQSPRYKSISRDSLDIYRKKQKKNGTPEDRKQNVESCLLKNFIKNVGRFYPKLSDISKTPLMSDYCTKKSYPKEKSGELKQEFTQEEDDIEKEETEEETEEESAKTTVCTTQIDNRYKCPFHHRPNYHHKRGHRNCPPKPEHLRNCHCIKVYLQTQMGKEWPGVKPFPKQERSSTEVSASKSSDVSKSKKNNSECSKPPNYYVGYTKVAYSEPVKSDEKGKCPAKEEQSKKEAMSICLCDKCGHIHCTFDKKPDKDAIEAQKSILKNENPCKENKSEAAPSDKTSGDGFPFFSFLSHLCKPKAPNSKSSKSMLKKISEVRTIKTCARSSKNSVSKDKDKCNCMPKIYEIEERLGELEKTKQLTERPQAEEIKKPCGGDSNASLPSCDKKEKKKKKKPKKCDCGEAPENNSSHLCCGEKEKKKKKKSKKKKPKKCCCTESKISNQTESAISIPEDDCKDKKKKKKSKTPKTCCDICCESQLGLNVGDCKPAEPICEDKKEKKKKKGKKGKKYCDCEEKEPAEANCDDDKKKKKKKKKKDKKGCECCVKKEEDPCRRPETAAFYHTVQYTSKDDSIENTTLEENSFFASKENFPSKMSRIRKKLSSAQLFSNKRNGRPVRNESDVENFLKQISYH